MAVEPDTNGGKTTPIPHKATRVFACSCSHGTFIDPAAREEALQFKRDFNPHLTIHLGDFTDMAAFMRSASGVERNQSIEDDYTAGINFLNELEPDVVFLGNHEDRLYRELHSGNQMVVGAAKYAIEKLEECVRHLRAELVPYTGALDTIGWRKFGPVLFGHGVMYNEQAARDHAEAFASYASHVVFGHIHKKLIQPGRTMYPTTGYSPGCLCNKPAMHYAKGRRATMAWQHSLLHGEITESDACLNLLTMKSNLPAPMPEISLPTP